MNNAAPPRPAVQCGVRTRCTNPGEREFKRCMQGVLGVRNRGNLVKKKEFHEKRFTKRFSRKAFQEKTLTNKESHEKILTTQVFSRKDSHDTSVLTTSVSRHKCSHAPAGSPSRRPRARPSRSARETSAARSSAAPQGKASGAR